MKLKIAFLLFAILFLLGCTIITKPIEQGTNCENSEDCFINNFSTCDKAFGTLTPNEDTEIYYQILEKKDTNCEIYFELNKAENFPSILAGLNSICVLNINEVMILQNEMNIEEFNCRGPLYNTIKQIKESYNTEQ